MPFATTTPMPPSVDTRRAEICATLPAPFAATICYAEPHCFLARAYARQQRVMAQMLFASRYRQEAKRQAMRAACAAVGRRGGQWWWW